MAAPGSAHFKVSLAPTSAGAGTDDLLTAILRANPSVSDLIFSPGKKFQVQANGAFVTMEMPGMPALTADDTRRIASDLIGNNKAAIATLREQGYCDVSYALPGLARFRVNVFIQRGSCAVVMRVIPSTIPDFKTLGLPEQLQEITQLHDGLVLIAGPRGSGKSSTLAALLDYINENRTCHIITIEDPIEFLHNHKRSTVHQRELYSDTPSVSQAMRAALRQAPNVIAVGELKDEETMELALQAAETGHVVFSTLNTLNARQTVERFVAAFPATEQCWVRERLARMLRYVISQRLVPKQADGGRVAVFEVVRSGSKSFDCWFKPDTDSSGGQDIDGLDLQIEQMVRAGILHPDTAIAHAINPRWVSNKLGISER